MTKRLFWFCLGAAAAVFAYSPVGQQADHAAQPVAMDEGDRLLPPDRLDLPADPAGA